MGSISWPSDIGAVVTVGRVLLYQRRMIVTSRTMRNG